MNICSLDVTGDWVCLMSSGNPLFNIKCSWSPAWTWVNSDTLWRNVRNLQIHKKIAQYINLISVRLSGMVLQMTTGKKPWSVGRYQEMDPTLLPAIVKIKLHNGIPNRCVTWQRGGVESDEREAVSQVGRMSSDWERRSRLGGKGGRGVQQTGKHKYLIQARLTGEQKAQRCFKNMSVSHRAERGAGSRGPGLDLWPAALLFIYFSTYMTTSLTQTLVFLSAQERIYDRSDH